jgi:hypothetical protein
MDLSKRWNRRELIKLLTTLNAGLLMGISGCWNTQANSSGKITSLDQLFKNLKGKFDGKIIYPEDELFNALRRTVSFNPRSDKKPSVIARCKTTADVAKALEIGKTAKVPIAVKGGGHDVLSASTCEGGLLIDLSLMNYLEVSETDKTVKVGAGVRAGQINEALDEYGLAAALGCNPSVGVSGLTLGGGLGWLLGRYGASCDNLKSVELVLADGRILNVDSYENNDLFWGLKGGGGNFGIVTSFEFHVHEVNKVVRGCFAYAGAQARDFMRLYREFMNHAPDELTLEVVIFASAEPPHAPVIIATGCYLGNMDDAKGLFSTLYESIPTIAHDIREVPYARIIDPVPESFERFISSGGDAQQRDETTASPISLGFNYWQGGSIQDWSDDAIDAFLNTASSAPPGWSMGLGHYQHGALCRVEKGSTALNRHEGSSSYFFNIGWGNLDESERAILWVDQSIAAMRKFADVPDYVNYLSSEEESDIANTYGSDYKKLQALKSKYDPNNIFHLNRNILPDN